jgi:UDP-GlcNAc:undecaprenyl-phosphate GlcNAc-1-phosphate transferase
VPPFASSPTAVPWLPLALAFGLALTVAWPSTALLIRLAPRLGLVDLPGARKVHTRPTPKGGGLAIYVAFLLTALTFGLATPAPPGQVDLLFLAAASAVVVLGVVDDRRPLPWQLRLGVQAAAAVAVLGATGALGAWSPALQEQALSARHPLWLPWPLAVVWIVGLTNAFNMLDNMDALSAGVAWVGAGAAALVLLLRPATAEPGDAVRAFPYVALMGALAGFLWFNRPPARIFMGDAGSTFLGFFFGVTTLGPDFAAGPPLPAWAAPCCLLAVPLYDCSSIVLLRLAQGRSPFHADKQHLSHRLTHWGLSSVTAVRVIHAMALASAAAGLLLYLLPGQTAVAVALAAAVSWAGFALLDIVVYRRKGSR